MTDVQTIVAGEEEESSEDEAPMLQEEPPVSTSKIPKAVRVESTSKSEDEKLAEADTKSEETSQPIDSDPDDDEEEPEPPVRRHSIQLSGSSVALDSVVSQLTVHTEKESHEHVLDKQKPDEMMKVKIESVLLKRDLRSHSIHVDEDDEDARVPGDHDTFTISEDAPAVLPEILHFKEQKSTELSKPVLVDRTSGGKTPPGSGVSTSPLRSAQSPKKPLKWSARIRTFLRKLESPSEEDVGSTSPRRGGVMTHSPVMTGTPRAASSQSSLKSIEEADPPDIERGLSTKSEHDSEMSDLSLEDAGESGKDSIVTPVFSFTVLDDEMLTTMGGSIEDSMSKPIDALRAEQIAVIERQLQVLEELKADDTWFSESDNEKLNEWLKVMAMIPAYERRVAALKSKLKELDGRVSRLKTSSTSIQSQLGIQ